MPTFTVVYSKGQAHLRGGAIEFEKQPGRHQLEVVASGKLDAFAKACEHFERLGLGVSVESDGQGQNSLGFTEIHVAALSERGVTLSTTPTSGIRIANIFAAI